jgi:hypothetical protein
VTVFILYSSFGLQLAEKSMTGIITNIPARALPVFMLDFVKVLS